LIFLPNPTDSQALSTLTGGSPLQILGRGTAELKVASPNFFGDVLIRGAQLTLSDSGQLASAWSFQIENGGTLFLDNSVTAHADRIANFARVELNAGTLHLSGSTSGSLTEQIGQLAFVGGANTLQLTHHASASDFTALGIDIFQPAINATFNLTANKRFGSAGDFDSVRLFVAPIFPFLFPIGDALAMGTVKGEDWVTTTTGSDNNTYFVAFEDYYTGDPDFWQSGHNVLIDGQAVPVYNYNTEISTLKLTNEATLGLFGILDFKGLLSTGAFDNQIGAYGELRFEYAHVYSPTLSIVDTVTIQTSNLVKTGTGTLRINTPRVTHRTTDLHIHQGKVALESSSSTLQARNIIVGDGTGTDILELPANSLNPIQGLGNSEQPNPRRNITLRGTPYGDPDSGESDAAILRFGGGTVQYFDDFRVEGRGTIDFVGGTSSAPNQLFIEDFFLGDPWSGDFSTTTVFVRNWEDGADVFLVRYKQDNIDRINSGYLARIKFEGYDTPTEWVSWSENNEYWQIRPSNEPEPATTGAILGAVGVGLIIWRRKRRASNKRADE